MPKAKMIAKICPACKAQVPVACKSCSCGHFFYNARRIAREFAIEADYLRRTARVRREKPNYYDALEYDKHIKKLKKRLSESRNDDDDDDDEVIEKKESKLRKKKQKKVEEEDEDDPMLKLTPDMVSHCSMILEHINSKIQLVTWKPKD
ncbi:UPF0547 protein C16orf87 homolog [Sitophilus oryzae]|uniref:UPF0547 protein C16orf87 homolog n=1 Tax=Sitophilus oryzae TaxID=7048 RepID=A0A6J2XZL2_SITOR|nr:UPF0547 protein C16orf87 homolog [Sitophilus oryzae]XP_030756497.1 UPF0547 protein C16orf87 homolog [Sitophilus oryzae]